MIMRQIFLLTTILLPFLSYGQLQETFEGPDVTTSYPWQGDTERFIINADNELQLKGYSGGGEEKLFLSSVPLYNNEWQGKARSEYKGTTGNYFRFFLWCENPDLEHPGEAIYVRMGYTKNNIALCHQTGNIRKKTLIEGRTLFEDAQEVEFRVVTDGNGLCTLYSKCLGEEEFYEEGTAEIPLYDAEGYFMMGVKYSSQHRQNKYIDDLYIERFTLQEEQPEEPEIKLALEDVEQENGEELLLYFNRPVIAEEADISLSELGEVFEIYQSYDEQILKLVWEDSREKGKQYILYYENLYDTDGNECAGEYTFTSGYGPTENEPEDPDGEDPETPGKGGVRINEIMADPVGLTELPETEYIELYNTSSEKISLKGWKFIYGDTKVTLKDFDLPAETYLILYREGRDIELASGGEEMPLDKFPAQLANSGKQLKLEDSSGKTVDQVTYEKATRGKSWEWSVNGWFLSTDKRGGTPGEKNSVFSEENPEEPEGPGSYAFGSILINEVMADPKGVPGLTETEYVELWNVSKSTISLKGWSFFYDEKEIKLEDYMITPDEYIILLREGREIEAGGYVMALASFPSQLANAGKPLALYDPSGGLIDEVYYETARPGVAWEREGDSFYLSSDDRGGTPGESNSDPSAGPGNPNEGGDPVEPFDIVFNELLSDPYSEGSEYIELYNRSGQSLSLSGLSLAVRKSDGELSTQYKLSDITIPIERDGYIVLTKAEEGVLSYYSTPYPENICKVRMPILNNNGSTLVLYRTEDGEIIDEVSYTSKWHDISIREEKGVALERIDPDGETQDEENWTSAVESVGFGTPGYQNSQYLKKNEGGSTGIEKPRYSHQTELYSILYSLDQPGYRCRAYIYSLSGRRVAEIANNELIGTSGELIWDGLGYNSAKLSPGPYVFYLELYHGSGVVKTYKEVFLVY